jgi:hypothetical protein
MNVIDVDMDGVWRRATTADRLTTIGVASCVAVLVADDATGQAWLIHAPTFGHDASELNSMLGAASDCCVRENVRIWAFGAAPDVEHGDDDDDDDQINWTAGARKEAEPAITATLQTINAHFPGVSPICKWGVPLNLSVAFTDGAWVCETMLAETSA